MVAINQEILPPLGQLILRVLCNGYLLILGVAQWEGIVMLEDFLVLSKFVFYS